MFVLKRYPSKVKSLVRVVHNQVDMATLAAVQVELKSSLVGGKLLEELLHKG